MIAAKAKGKTSLAAAQTTIDRERPRQGDNAESRLVQNTISNVLSQIIISALTFFSTPYITRRLGASQYGAFSLLMTYLFAFSLLNLGINTSLVKYLAELLPQNRLKDVQNYFSTSLTVLVGFGMLIGVAVFILAGPIVQHSFKGPSSLAPSTILALRLASTAFILQFLAQVLSSIPTATQRFEILNLVRAGSEALRIIVTVVLLSLGFGLPSLMVVVLFASMCACLAYALASKRLMPALSLVPGFSVPHLHSLVKHSKYVLLVNASNQLVSTADNFLIAIFLPIANVAYYGIAYNLAQRLWIIVANIVSAVFPAASAFAGADKRGQVRELYLRGMKIAAAVGCFPALSLCLFSRPFLLFWLGPDYANEGSLVLVLLTLGFLINSFTHVPYQVLQSTHHADTAAKGAVIYSVVNLVLFVLLIPPFGIQGAAVAFLMAQIFFVPWFVQKSNHLLGVRWRSVIVISYARVLLAACLACSVCWLCRPWIHSLLSLASVIVGGFIFYLLAVAILVLDGKELAACRWLLRKWMTSLARSCSCMTKNFTG